MSGSLKELRKELDDFRQKYHAQFITAQGELEKCRNEGMESAMDVAISKIDLLIKISQTRVQLAEKWNDIVRNLPDSPFRDGTGVYDPMYRSKVPNVPRLLVDDTLAYLESDE